MTLELGLQLAQGQEILRWQLENTLQAQLIYRGPLLTNAIKLGYLDEDRALAFCSRQYGITVIDDTVLNHIPERIINLIPVDLVNNWRILPVGIQESVLMVVSHIPMSAEIIDDLEFLVGMPVKPLLCREDTLIRHILYYHTVGLPSWIVDERAAKQFAAPEPLDPSTLTPPPKDNTTLIPEDESSTDESAQDLSEHDEAATSEPVADTRLDIDSFEDTMALAESRDEIISAACTWLAQWFEPVIFLTIKGELAHGFHVVTSGEPVEIKNLEVVLSEGAVDRAANSGEAQITSSVGDVPLARVKTFFGLMVDQNVMVLPVHLKGRLIGMLVAFRDATLPMPSDTPDTWERIRRITSDTFETLILSKKIGV